MKKTIFLLALLGLVIMTGCTGERLQITGEDTRYLPLGESCQTDQKCQDFVDVQGGDGSKAKCIDEQCVYPVPLTKPQRGD